MGGRLYLSNHRKVKRTGVANDGKIERPKAAGGVSTKGQPGLFKRADELPRLTAENITKACDQVTGRDNAYRALLYLTHARLHDLPALFEASRASDVAVRWQRLWILCPFITKMSRSQEGRASLQ